MARPPYIINKFAEELSVTLSAYLTNSKLGDERFPLKDRLAIKLMLTLNKKSIGTGCYFVISVKNLLI